MITSYNSGSLGSLAPSIGNVEGARDPNDRKLYDVIIGNVGELEILMIQSCMMLSLVMWRELDL
jgi:hypothetical protein